MVAVNRTDFFGGRRLLYFHSDRPIRPSVIKSGVPSLNRYIGGKVDKIVGRCFKSAHVLRATSRSHLLCICLLVCLFVCKYIMILYLFACVHNLQMHVTGFVKFSAGKI